MNNNKKINKSYMIDENSLHKLDEIHEISSKSYSDLICEAIALLHDEKIGAKAVLK